MCPDCHRPKMLFETERKAQDFIRWNGDSMEYGSETLRAYYCPSCCGWHISHHEHKERYDRQTDNMLEAYRRRIKKSHSERIDHLLTPDGQAIARQAEEIFNQIPDNIRRTTLKGVIKGYLTDYFKKIQVADRSGTLRSEIYRLWRENGRKKLYR